VEDLLDALQAGPDDRPIPYVTFDELVAVAGEISARTTAQVIQDPD
jgi:hypothetical protein